MTNAELVAAINANPTALAQVTTGQDNACAATISATLAPTLVPTLISERSLYSAFANPADALQVIEALTGLAAGNPDASPPVAPNPIVASVLSWLAPNNGGVDVSNPAVIAMLGEMVAGALITQAQSDTIQALAQVPTDISAGQVSDAWLPNRPGGIVGGNN